MKINRTTAVIVGLALLALFALDAWGDQLGMAPHALARIQRAVAGLSILAAGSRRSWAWSWPSGSSWAQGVAALRP
jgi:hypothetical protein